MLQQRIHKTYKYKLKPTPEQACMLERTVLLCRYVYNAAVGERREAWRLRAISVTYYQQKAEPAGIKEAMPEYADVHSQVLQDVVLRVDRAFQAFFRRAQSGEGGKAPGYPRFHGRNRYTSFTYPQFENGVRLDKGLLVLSKIGRGAVRWSRPVEGTPKSLTVIREADGWYVSISCAEVPMHPLAPTGQETGIDLGLESLATLTDGTMIHNLRCCRQAEACLRRCARRVTRRKKNSNRRKKAVKLLAKAHLKVKRQRQDFHHQAALALVRQHDTIFFEDVQTANMLKNHHLAKSISEAGWSSFLAIRVCKAAYAGKQAVAVPPAYTSQQCSGCKRVVWKSLSTRWHQCSYEDCAVSLQRDHNAALNILALGKNPNGSGRAPRTRTWRGAACVA
ncbi:MAG TPA: transposase [Ktedonobacterales bacterium]|jgi:putative transposase|nr:transposase [Ktedonobacterales bacterium]